MINWIKGHKGKHNSSVSCSQLFCSVLLDGKSV